MNLPEGKPHETDQSREKKKREEMREIQRQEKGTREGGGEVKLTLVKINLFEASRKIGLKISTLFSPPPLFFFRQSGSFWSSRAKWSYSFLRSLAIQKEKNDFVYLDSTNLKVEGRSKRSPHVFPLFSFLIYLFLIRRKTRIRASLVGFFDSPTYFFYTLDVRCFYQ